MAVFTITIAGCTVQITSLFDSTRDYCCRYFATGTPEFFLQVSKEELAREQELLRREAAREGLKPRTFSDPFLERSILQRRLAQQLLNRDILLVHGSTVAVDGEAYLFTAAKCGTGKSTHTRFWREVFSSRAVMVNDDKPFLKITPEGVLACGAPWSGKHGLDTNICVPLKGICALRRGSENRIFPLEPEKALTMLQAQSCPPETCGQEALFLHLVSSLASTVPLWQMTCTKDPSAAQIAYEAMSSIQK